MDPPSRLASAAHGVAKVNAEGQRPLIRVSAVQGKRDLNVFLTVPEIVYESDRRWVHPLNVERRQHLSKRNPFFSHARARFWVAFDGERPVGRISAQVDDLHLRQYGDATGYFGMLEAIDDRRVFRALVSEAEGWLREQGMRRVRGPFSLSINDECGLLVDGFDTPPMFMMPHGRSYYDARVKEQGYHKAKDTLAYLVDPSVIPPPVMQATVKRASESLRVRPIRLSHLREDLAILRDIFNDAWAANWGFVPFTPGELDSLGSSLRLFVPPEFVQIAEVEGRPAAMIVVVPNLNEAIAGLRGRLLPFGWTRLLWRLRKGVIKTARVPLMGVRREFQRSALGMALAFLLIEAIRRPLVERGIRNVELSWILEDNRAMRHVNERIGAQPYKRYRIYEKTLDGAPVDAGRTFADGGGS
jgi:hypothetical protein